MNQEARPQQNQRRVETPEQKRKRINDEYKKKAEQQKKRWMPLVRYMKKHHIKFKTARCKNYRVQYFRTDQLEALITKNQETLEKDTALKELVKTWNKDVIYFQRPDTAQKHKYPKELQKTESNVVSKFASFKFDTSQSKSWIFHIIVVGVIAAVLFPLWPYSIKYGIFMVLLAVVVVLLSLIVLRLVVYLIFAVFGVSFWIFPNFFADVSIIDSFKPFYESTKWQSGVFSIIGRLLALSILVYYGYHIYIDPSWVYENIEITKTSMEDLHDWGVGKIKGEKNFSQSALTNLDHIMNQTAEATADETVNLENSESTENTNKQSEEAEEVEEDKEKVEQEDSVTTQQNSEAHQEAEKNVADHIL